MPGAPIDPWSAGFMALGSIASAPPPSQTASMVSTNTFDNSGFVVNVGGGTATSTKTAIPTVAQSAGAVAAGVGGLLSNPAVVVGLGVVLFFCLKKR